MHSAHSAQQLCHADVLLSLTSWSLWSLFHTLHGSSCQATLPLCTFMAELDSDVASAAHSETKALATRHQERST
jgi:hypothetical protein